MTAAAEEPSIDEIMLHMRRQLEYDHELRRDLGTAVRIKDAGAVAKIARGLLEGLKVIAPYALSAVLAAFGIAWSP